VFPSDQVAEEHGIDVLSNMNITKEEVLKLAKLAQMEIGDDELLTMQRDLGAILGYVSVIEKADVSGVTHSPPLVNVLREDSDPHESCLYTELLLNSAPRRVGSYVAVPQVRVNKKSVARENVSISEDVKVIKK